MGAFLQVVMGLDLPPEAIATLEQRTEGWIAGLQPEVLQTTPSSLFYYFAWVTCCESGTSWIR